MAVSECGQDTETLPAKESQPANCAVRSRWQVGMGPAGRTAERTLAVHEAEGERWVDYNANRGGCNMVQSAENSRESSYLTRSNTTARWPRATSRQWSFALS